MVKIFKYFQETLRSRSLKKKLLFTLILLVIYRLLVVIPVPFANIDVLMQKFDSGV
jgi:preprotein translocase subunit SecY